MNPKWIMVGMGWACVLMLVFLVVIGWRSQAQSVPATNPPAPTTPAATYEPTEVENLSLQVKQRDAVLAQVALAQASANFHKAVADFNAQVEIVKKAHGWPATVEVDPTALRNNEIKFFLAPTREPGRKPAEKDGTAK